MTKRIVLLGVKFQKMRHLIKDKAIFNTLKNCCLIWIFQNDFDFCC